MFPAWPCGGLALASPPWCKVVTILERRVTMKKADRKAMKSQRTSLVRASISFPPGLYGTLEKIAKQKKVSLAWVVRDAAERYVAVESKLGRGA
jgi:hypothetical protein